MKMIKKTRVCVKCKCERNWVDYDIQWAADGSWENSYLKRVCKTCESAGGDNSSLEKKAINRELQKLARKKLKLQEEMDDLDVSINEKLESLKLFK